MSSISVLHVKKDDKFSNATAVLLFTVVLFLVTKINTLE